MTPEEIIAFLHNLGCDFEVINSKHIIRITQIPSKQPLSEVLDKISTQTDYLYTANMTTLLTRKEPDESPYMTMRQTLLFLHRLECDFEICPKEKQIKINQIPSEIALKKINRLYLKREYKTETDVYVTISLKEYRSQLL